MTRLRAEPYNVYTHHAAAVEISYQLRPEDEYEVMSVGLKVRDVPVIIELSARLGEAHILYWDDKPTFVWGVSSAYQGLYGLWGFGTKDTRRAMPAITRWGMKTWLPDFIARTHARRIEVRVPVSSVHSINWLKQLGMIPECTLKHYSVIGEDFMQLAYTPKFEVNPYVSPRPIQDAYSTASDCSTY